jgi:hypothetical protein
MPIPAPSIPTVNGSRCDSASVRFERTTLRPEGVGTRCRAGEAGLVGEEKVGSGLRFAGVTVV